MRLLSDKEVKDVFFKLEAAPKTFSYRINNTSLYFILRFNIEIHYRDHQKAEVVSTGTRVKMQLKQMLKNLKDRKTRRPAEMPHDIASSPLLFVSTSDWLLSPGESAELVEIIKYYRTQGETINFVQPDYFGNSITRQSYHDGFFRIRTGDRVRLSSGEKKTIKDFIAYISGCLGIDLRGKYREYADYIAYVFSMATQLTQAISAANAERVFVRSVYTNPWVLMACRQTGCKCIEVQHGTLNPDSIYYQFNDVSVTSHLLMPDYILTVGEQWRKIVLNQDNHYSPAAVINLGCNEDALFGQWDGQPPFQVLICLQHGIFSIDDELVSFLDRFGSRLHKEGIHIRVRPHPHSVRQTMQTYERFTGAYFKIVNSREIPFLDDLRHTDVLLSPASMCLYEAISFGIAAVSFEKFRGVTIDNELMYVNSDHELFDFIVSVKKGVYKQKKVEYLSPFNESVLRNFLTVNPGVNEAVKYSVSL